MSYDAGDVEARLTLDRDPFTDGLRLAREQAKRFEQKKIEAKIKVTIEGSKEAEKLITRLNNLNRRVIRPRVVLDGVAKVLSQITTINRRLTALGNRVVRPRVVVSVVGAARARNILNNIARTRRAIINPIVNPPNTHQANQSLNRFRRTINELGKVIFSTLQYSGIVGGKAFGAIAKGGSAAVAGVAALVIKLGLLSAKLGFTITKIFMMGGAITYLIGGITTLVGVLPNLITLLGAPIAAIALGWDGVKKAAETLRPQIEKLKKTLSDTLYRVTLPGFKQLRQLFPTVETGLNNIARRAGEFFVHMTKVATTERNVKRLSSALDGALQFWVRLEKPIEQVFESMMAVAGTERLYQLLGQTIGSTLYQLSRFFDKLLETGRLVEGMTNLRDVIVRIVDTILEFAVNAVDFFNAATDGVIEFFASIKSGMGNMDWEGFGRAWGEIAAAIGEIFKNIPKETWDSVVGSLERFAETLGDPKVQEGIILVISLIDDLIDSFTKFVEIIAKAIWWHDFLSEKMNEFFDWVEDKITTWREGVLNRWNDTWEQMTRKADDDSSVIGGIVDTFLHDLSNFFSGWGVNTTEMWSNAWNFISLKSAEIMLKVRNKINEILDWIVRDFRNGVQWVKDEWARLKQAAEEPVRFFVEVVYNRGIVPTWNAVAGAFGMKKLSPAGFEQGGIIPGYRPGVDTVPALVGGVKPVSLSEGEGILVPEAVRGLGTDFVFWANKFFSNGRVRTSGSNEHYADGGIVGMWNKISGVFTDPAGTIKKLFSSVIATSRNTPGSGIFTQGIRNIPGKMIEGIVKKVKEWVSSLGDSIGGMSGPGGWQWQMAVLRSVFPGLQLISGFRPGSITATGNLSYHARGRAVDVPPRMDVFNFIRSAFGGSTKELIFSPAGGHQLWNGRPHYYGEPTRGDHWDHVHWAYDNGGVLPPGVTVAHNNTTKNEYVFTGDDINQLRTAILRLVSMLTNNEDRAQVVVNASTSNATLQQLIGEITFVLRHTSKKVRGV